MNLHQFTRNTFVCLLSSSLALAATPPSPAPAAGPVAPEAMAGLAFDGLTPDQKTLAISILNDNGCDCGCNVNRGREHSLHQWLLWAGAKHECDGYGYGAPSAAGAKTSERRSSTWSKKGKAATRS